MNVHAAPPADTATPFRRRHDDRDLIAACKRAKALFDKERTLELALFKLEDRVGDQEPATLRARAAWQKASARVVAMIADIVELRCFTPEGLAYRAALLPLWHRAGYGFLDGAEELALVIAKDACRIGTDAHMDLRRLQREQRSRARRRAS